MMDRTEYEARKAGIKRMRSAAGRELERIRRTPGGPLIDHGYRRAVARYLATQDVLREFIRRHCQPEGGARSVFGRNERVSGP
jgi:hypothetical protein